MFLFFALTISFILVLFFTSIYGRVHSMLVSTLLTLFICFDIYIFVDYININESTFLRIQKVVIFILVHATLGGVALKLLNFGKCLGFQTLLKLVSFCLLAYGFSGYFVHVSRINNETKLRSTFYKNYEDYLLLDVLMTFFGIFGILCQFLDEDENYEQNLTNETQTDSSTENSFNHSSGIPPTGISTSPPPRTSIETLSLGELSNSKLVEINHKWIVNNFACADFCTNHPYIDSHEFGNEQTKFFLRIYPRGKIALSNSISLYLGLKSCKNDKLTAAFTCGFVNKYGQANTKEYKDELGLSKLYGWDQFLLRDVLIGNQNLYLDDGKLVIMCKIWFKNETDICESKAKRQPPHSSEPLEFDDWLSGIKRKYSRKK